MTTPTVRDRQVRTWTSADPEPDDAVRLLVEVAGTDRAPLYLARFHHGWLWVPDRSHLSHSNTTPLAWRWAISADNGAVSTVRELTAEESERWHRNGDARGIPRARRPHGQAVTFDSPVRCGQIHPGGERPGWRRNGKR